MAIQDKQVLKTYYETGDVPTQSQFESLIDSFKHKNQDVYLMQNDVGFTPTITENGTVTISWTTGQLFLVNSAKSKYLYLIDRLNGGTISLPSSTFCYIKQSDFQNTVSGGNIPVYYSSWSDYALFNSDDFIPIAYHNVGGVLNACGGMFVDFVRRYRTNVVKNDIYFFSNQALDLDVTVNEETGTDSFDIEVDGELYLVSPKHNKYYELQSNGLKTFTLNHATNGCMYIKESDLVATAQGGVLPVHYTAWSSYATLQDQNNIVLAVNNKGGRMQDATGIFIDFIHKQLFKSSQANLFEAMFGTNDAYGFVGGVFRLYAHIPFNNGSNEPLNGNSLVGATSGNAYNVHSVKVNSGSWSGGDAEGFIVIHSRADYLSAPYSAGEVLNNATQSNTVGNLNGLAYGGWQQIDGAHKSTNITDFLTTNSNYFQIPHAIGVSNVVSFVFCWDEGNHNYGVGASVGINFSNVYVRKLTANLSTGEIRETVQDFTNLANCTFDNNIWALGVFKK